MSAPSLQAFIGEFAGGDNAVCQQAVTNTLSYATANSDAYWGWSWWAGEHSRRPPSPLPSRRHRLIDPGPPCAAGPWWGDYMYSLEPGAPPNVDKPQMAWLEPFTAGTL